MFVFVCLAFARLLGCLLAFDSASPSGFRVSACWLLCASDWCSLLLIGFGFLLFVFACLLAAWLVACLLAVASAFLFWFCFC